MTDKGNNRSTGNERTYVQGIPLTSQATSVQQKSDLVELQQVVVVQPMLALEGHPGPFSSTTAHAVTPGSHHLLEKKDYIRLIAIAILCATIGSIMYHFGLQQQPQFVPANDQHPAYVHYVPSYPILSDMVPYAYCFCDIAFYIIVALIAVHYLPKGLQNSLERLEECNVIRT